MTCATAQIVFGDGSVTLPADSAYDRQELVERVRQQARANRPFRVGVDRRTWMIEPPGSAVRLACHQCGRLIDRAVCRLQNKRSAAYCVACALARPQLTIGMLSQLPAGAVLRDVQAESVRRGQLMAWTRWPRATPAEIIDDMRLQRRYAPTLRWRCTEICPPSSDANPNLNAPQTISSVSRPQDYRAQLWFLLTGIAKYMGQRLWLGVVKSPSFRGHRPPREGRGKGSRTTLRD